MLQIFLNDAINAVIDLKYCFYVSAVGHETEHWSVYRRYLEFYVLESKLTEFHGKFSASALFFKIFIF